MQKIHPNDIIITNEQIVKLKDSCFDIKLLKDDFTKLSTEDFNKKYFLSFRALDKLIKLLDLHKVRLSPTDMFLQNIDQELFIADYRSMSKKALLEKYNVTPSVLVSAAKKLGVKLTQEEITNRVKLTNLEKYGTEWFSSTSDWQEAVKATKLDRYGDENYNNKEKAAATCLKKYGVSNANKTKETREKIRQTNLAKYGVESFYQTDAFKQKAAETKLAKYGDATFTNREKADQTCLERYGVRNPNQNEEVKRKRAETNLKKYGHENVFANDEIKEKIKQTIEQKYGVPYACMTEQCRNAAVLENSSANISFMKLLDDNNISYEREFTIRNKSYDFKVDKYLIEINPTATHNSTWGWRGNKDSGLDKYYHQEKSALAKNNGYQCICVWDWDDENKIINLLKPRKKCFARNCDIKEISQQEEIDFLNSYHLQGYIASDICLGLFFGDTLVSVMSFGKPRYNKNYEYELLRYCSSMLVVGGEEKLFTYFCKAYAPVSIISYCDLSKFPGKIYDKLGFMLKSDKIKPSKHWSHPYYKTHVTDNLLRQRGFDQLFGTNFGKNVSNNDLMLNAGFVEVYDCGQATYVYVNKESEKVEC